MFQKDPQILMAHPGEGIDKFEDLKKLTLFISKEGIASYFQWLKADFGFSEAQGEALHVEPAAVSRRQAQRHAGLRDVGALRGREGGGLQAEGLPASPTRASTAIRP